VLKQFVDVWIIAEKAGAVVRSQWTLNRFINKAFYQTNKANPLGYTDIRVRQLSLPLFQPVVVSR
jgi:hypothetical protein